MTTPSVVSHRSTTTRRTPLEHHRAATEVLRNSGHPLAPKLEHLAVDITTLYELPGNPRKGDVDAVTRSYATFGQQKPIIVQRRGRKTVVIDGNHQLKAARQLGWDRIAVSPFKVKDPKTGRVRAGTVAEADAYALAVNRTADLGVYDDG